MRPLVGSSKPASMRISVVLPQPEGPRRQKNSPRKMSRERSSTATASPKRFVTRSKRMSGTAAGSAQGAKERRTAPTEWRL